MIGRLRKLCRELSSVRRELDMESASSIVTAQQPSTHYTLPAPANTRYAALGASLESCIMFALAATSRLTLTTFARYETMSRSYQVRH